MVLFLTIETVLSVSPVPTKLTIAPVVSNSEPLITIVALPPALESITADVTDEPPSNVKLFIIGAVSYTHLTLPTSG